MPFISYAQNYQDVILWRALHDVEQGFYVDIGAADPQVDSVTCAFYKRGWSGINVEPLDQHFAKLAHERPRDTNLKVAVGREVGLRTFHAIQGTGLSTLDPQIAARQQAAGWEVHDTVVPILTLAKILEDCAPPTIHFLKIDVEGTEAEVLEGLNLERIRPWIIVIESTAPSFVTEGSAPLSQVITREAWEHLITDNRYHFAYFDGLNCFYVADEVAALKERLAVPPNVLDDFIRFPEWAIRKEATELRSEISGLRAHADELEAAWKAERTKSVKLRDALQGEQEQNERLREQGASLQARIHQAEAQLSVPSVGRAIGRAFKRVQESGDRFTGGGVRSLARRTLTRLAQRSKRSRVLMALGRIMLKPFPKVATTLYQLATKENSVATSRSEDRNDVEDVRKSAADFIFEDLHRGGLTGEVRYDISNIRREELNLVKERILTEIDHRYRGPELNLKAQLEFYLPHIQEISKLGTVIDVWCGRGTFLEIMRDHQIEAIGLELNENQIENCRRKKLDVRLTDALEFLCRSEADQYGAITLFHVIEHLDFETLVTILMEAYRVVAPGGIVLMETRNAENLYGSAYMFNQDPTHVKPITYQYISTVLEVLGFECERLPVSASLHDDDGGETGNRHLNYLLSVSANLSVIARKPRYDS